MKILEGILAVILGIWLIAVILPGPIKDIISETYSEPFSVTTNANETTTTEILTYDNYYEDLTGMSASSDNAGDYPVVLSYNPDTKSTLVGGLQNATSRILTIDYTREASKASLFYGTIPLWKMVPLIIGLLLIGVFIWGAFKKRMGG
jgi:hypothetical protein